MAIHYNLEEDTDALKQDPVIVVVVPFPAQGHLNPTLQFSRLILSHNIPVHYVGSQIHNRQAKLRTNLLDVSQIQFHDFPIPPFSSPATDPNAPIKFPGHLQPSFEAYLYLRQPVAALLHALSPTTKRIVIVYDPLLSSVIQDAAFIPNTECYAFHCSSTFFASFFKAMATEKPFEIEAEIPNALLTLEGLFTSEFMNFVADQEPFRKIKAGDLYNTSRLIEGAYIDRLAKEEMVNENTQWAIGPLIHVTIGERNNSTTQGRCFDWLNKQAQKSVIYISFGTTTSMADDQIKELATGLEESKTKFIWVLRDADRGDVFTKDVRSAQLPEGFEERTEEVGMVVRDWMPQLEILGHPSTGGFMTHCGWNSCLESISMGVPIAAWPMHSDQPSNAVLLTKLLKVGLVVREWAQREEIVTSATIKEAVRRLMASEEGAAMRKRAEKLGGEVQQSVTDGGVSYMERESFIAHITR